MSVASTRPNTFRPRDGVPGQVFVSVAARQACTALNPHLAFVNTQQVGIVQVKVQREVPIRRGRCASDLFLAYSALIWPC